MDFVNDRNPRAVYLADQLVGLPEYVKTASQIQPEDLVGLADVAFAAPGAREFPIHDKAATWLSAAYAIGSGQWERVGERIKVAADFHEITSDIDALLPAFQEHSKAASAPLSQYALSVDFEGAGGLGRKDLYPINDSYDILKSARTMLIDADKQVLPLAWFRTAAQELIKAARAYDVDLEDIHPRVRAVGEERLPDFEHALTCVGLRKAAGVDDEALELYKMAAHGARDEPQAMDKWLGLWLELDTTYGVKYAAHQPNPYEAFYSGEVVPDIEKMASEVVFIEGVAIPKTVIALVPEVRVQQNFSKAAAEKILEAQKVAHATPEQASAIFDEMSEEERREFLGMLVNA